MTKLTELDAFDRRLLDLVRRDNQMPARALAETVGLSESAVLRRLRRLRAEGVITADVSVVRPEALGLGLTMHVLVAMEREGSAVLDAFARKIAGRPEVHQAWYVTGESDFVLLVRVASMEDYERFTRATLNDDPNVRSFRTIIAIREVVEARTPSALA
ncbi:Lrp/AsnC family transcriptional regulator [Chenggangzhangella methanolivorans]|uniref:Lrp/AsnC family transcriptional regulator n=1 Tax=Chenggangzhangella methanolivorans TaxID=1437009 RepID=A0A9E6R6M1_9HYPH|nr:Lrp/AsnC family transcriptional regulator [Chenggangzhangella methanolivorans]QZN98903.1 Lrp/AsnC family transcriptional regulator [Chenggangzhangella methanolivorans]